MKTLLISIAISLTTIVSAQNKQLIDTLVPINNHPTYGYQRKIELKSLLENFHDKYMILSGWIIPYNADTAYITSNSPLIPFELMASNSNRVNPATGVLMSDTCMVTGMGEYDFLRYLATQPISQMSQIYHYITQGVVLHSFDK